MIIVPGVVCSVHMHHAILSLVQSHVYRTYRPAMPAGAVQLAGVGIVAGVVLSASTASMMASLLYGVRPHDPAVFLIVPLLLLAVAVLASYLPAWRATKVDPMIALREA